ncbi:MAG: undecaprenyl-diphosphate phosphatase, partial [Actinomycetota bacterium]
MSLLQALVLGLVQGLTEFLPVSSSAHLVLVPALAGWESPGLAFLTFLHAGTLLGLIVYFRRDLLWLAGGVFSPGPRRSLLLLMALATVPGALIGVLFEKQFEAQFGRPVSVGFQLAFSGVILIAADLIARRKATPGASSEPAGLEGPAGADAALAESVTPVTALGVGFAQAVSIVPGISRSGATIGAAMAAGLTRSQAARFSFLVAIPILAGAVIFELPKLSGGSAGGAALAVGFIASAV